MGLNAQERRLRQEMESSFNILRENDEVNTRETCEEIKREAMERFEQFLDGKIANLQDGEHLMILFRIDIVQDSGKVRGGSGSQRNMPEYIEWRSAVYERDNWTCQECGTQGPLNAHHIKSWAHHPEFRFDIDNGVTLCEKCHAEKHPHLNMISNLVE